MKKIRITTILFLLLAGSIGFTYGQKHSLDSVNVKIEDRSSLNLAIYNYEDLGDNLENDLKSLRLILTETKDIPEKISYSIHFEPDNLVSIKQSPPGERIIWENGEQTRVQFNNHCYITSDNYNLQIQFNELEALISDSLIIKLKEVIDTTNNIQGRFSSTFNYSFQGDHLSHNKQFDEINGKMDFIHLKGGVGVSLIKNQPVIDLSAEVGFVFSKKGILKNQYYLSYNQMFDWADSSKVNLNGFLNVGYRYNLSKTAGSPNWLGVELGYLVGRNGDLFGKDTFKFAVNWELGRYISVSPQLYLSGDFKEFYPAVRIGFGF